MWKIYSGSRLDAIQFDLSPNLSPFRREALNLTPLPYKGRGWGLGLYCTQLITAIVKWEKALCGTTLLKQSTLDMMWTPHPPNRGDDWEKLRYVAGLGWWVLNYGDRRVVGHNGSILGFASNITRFIDDKITVILFCNLDKISRPDAIAKKIAGYYCPVLTQLKLQPPLGGDEGAGEALDF